MDREEEKDLYIKSKLKEDNKIPEKIDNLFNDSARLIENEGGSYMEENNQQSNKNKNQIIVKRVAAVAACAVIALGGGNIYATTQGYDNVFFMIKEWISPSEEVHGKDEILSDRDITISYKSIEVAKGIKMQINRLVVKDNEARLHLKIDKAETELDITPFEYIVKDENGNEICNYVSEKQEMIHTEELKLEGLKKDAEKLELEVKQKDGKTLVTFNIDLENKQIEVIGNEQELQKISEEELKKYLGAFALLNYEDDTLNTGVSDRGILENVRNLMVANQISKIENIDSKKIIEIMSCFTDLISSKEAINKYNELAGNVEGLCIDVTDIIYSQGIYTVTFTYCYPTAEDIKENRVEDLPVYEMTIGLTINKNDIYSKYYVSSKMESKLVKPGNAKNEELNIVEISEKCKETIEKYLLLLGRAEGSPQAVLQELNLINYSEFEELRQNENNIQGDYIRTTIKYEKFRSLMLSYMTEELYENSFGRKYKNLSGYVGVLDAGATGISFEIREVQFESTTKEKCVCKVEYIEEPSEGEIQQMSITLVLNNGSYVVSNIEDLISYISDITPTVDEELKKFVGKWYLDYAIGDYEYEQKLENVHEGNAITITIKDDGTFEELVQDTELLMGKYTKINEKTIKRVYEDGRIIYTTYSTNALGEIVISNTSRANQTITEYYSQKDVDIHETKDYFIGNWWRTMNNGIEEEYKYMVSIRSDGQFLLVKENKIKEIGTYRVKDNGNEDVPYIILKFNDGTEKQLKLIQGSESYLMTQDLKEQYEYHDTVG